MGSKEVINLPWHFEAFREYSSYPVLLSAASVLYQFEGEEISVSNPRIQQMQRLLAIRTNKNSWIPNRSGSADVDWNLEGDLYRNKGRLLSSFFILEPKDASNPPSVRLLPFGSALARGEISEQKFYDFIITRFRYPHPAWEENWIAWNQAVRSLHPFAYILQVLIELDAASQDPVYITTDEAARYLYPVSDHRKTKALAQEILTNRGNTPSKRERSDDIDRKITDVFGFLCLSGYCYYCPGGKSIGLNLRDRHLKELTIFERNRLNQDRLRNIKNLVAFIH
jgi:hypothetical protein